MINKIACYIIPGTLFMILFCYTWNLGMLQAELVVKWRQDHDKLILLEKRVSEMESKK